MLTANVYSGRTFLKRAIIWRQFWAVALYLRKECDTTIDYPTMQGWETGFSVFFRFFRLFQMMKKSLKIFKKFLKMYLKKFFFTKL